MDPSLLPSLAWFAHIAQHRSFTKAAAQMGVSRAALSQNPKALEKQLNVKLLYRTTRDMSLTEEGQRLLEALTPALSTIEHAVGTLEESRHEPAGLLRINTSRTAAKHFIEPHIGEFLMRYPRLKLELVMDDGMASIISEGYDAGIRLGESLAEHMVAIPITPQVALAAVATPQYLSRYGTPATPADLVNHNCIAFRHATSGAIYQWEFSTVERHARHTFSVEPKGSVITNDDDGMIRAALQHVGIIQHFDFAVKAMVERGELVRILQAWSQPFPGFYLYIPSCEHMSSKVRALLDFLVEKRAG
ncbi:LysR family transcriptional regulator [Serratia marcescens]|uniref:LysR family transcriptional regulator n=1 Tax=Serratia marcescens TaxID=615 RepID=UPI0020C5951E|nr:LysR family transcriptional regulator [Serratia marcescens]UTL88096.1 LysR family transcriptional regulator [Serratia marcescens]